MVVVGSRLSRSGRAMREPVTTTSCNSSAAATFGGGVWACAPKEIANREVSARALRGAHEKPTASRVPGVVIVYSSLQSYVYIRLPVCDRLAACCQHVSNA